MLGGNHVHDGHSARAQRAGFGRGASLKQCTARPSPRPRTIARRSPMAMSAKATIIQRKFPKSHVVRIIRPRVEETLEFLRDSAGQAGFWRRARASRGADRRRLPAHRRAEAARRVLAGRSGSDVPRRRRLPRRRLSARLRAVAGLFVYPQVAGREYFEPRREQRLANGSNGYSRRGTVADGEFLDGKPKWPRGRLRGEDGPWRRVNGRSSALVHRKAQL